MFQNFIGTKVLRFVGKKTDGKKLYGGGAGAILVALAGFLGIAYPDIVAQYQLPTLSFEACVELLFIGWAAIAGGHKIEKTKKAIEKSGTQPWEGENADTSP